MTPTLTRLYQLLAKLFLEQADADTIVADAGINRSHVKADATALGRWFSIVNEAERDGKVAALLATALSRYPKHEELLALQAELRRVDAEREAQDYFLAMAIIGIGA